MIASAREGQTGITPFDPLGGELTGLNIGNLKRGTCETGDSCVTEASMNYEVIDMEAYALAKVCRKFGVDFACVKYISDNPKITSVQNLEWKAMFKDYNKKLTYVLGRNFECPKSSGCINAFPGSLDWKGSQIGKSRSTFFFQSLKPPFSTSTPPPISLSVS